MPDDDLFKDSTMTFGEHLEELRGALFRSCAGLLVALLIAIFVADEVVTWIETPLRRGLRSFYLAKAKQQLATEYGTEGQGGNASLDDWAILEQLNWAPQVIRVSRKDLERVLASAGAELSVDEEGWQLAELSDAAARSIRRDLVRGADRSQSASGIAWRHLSPAQQNGLQASEDLTQVRDAVNDLVAKRGLWRELYPAVIDECEDVDHRKIIETAYQHLQEHDDQREALALNRQLLQLAFPEMTPARPEMLEFITWSPLDVQVQALSVHEPFLIYLKAALVVAFILSSPWIFFQIWLFVAAGLYPHEKQLVFTFLPFSIGLFLLGACLAFFFVFEPVLDFLFSFNLKINVNAEPRITDWMSFVLLLPLGFGVSFQLPLVMLFMERIGIFTVESYLAQWRIAVLAIFVLSMFLTPADPISMILMAVPLTLLFFGGVLLCKYFPQHYARKRVD